MIFTVKEERERYVKRILDLGTNLTEKEIGLLLDEKRCHKSSRRGR